MKRINKKEITSFNDFSYFKSSNGRKQGITEERKDKNGVKCNAIIINGKWEFSVDDIEDLLNIPNWIFYIDEEFDYCNR